MRRPLLVLVAAAAALEGCGGDCAAQAERKLECPDGYVGYGRRKPNQNKDWVPEYSLVDLSRWSAEGTYQDGGRCESGCVPIALGESLAVCDAWQPCGGDLIGDWRWEPAACPYEVPVDLDGACADSVQSLAVSSDGTYAFEADLTLRYIATELYETDTVAIPASCLATLDECTDLFGTGDTCAGDPATGCTCTGERQTIPITWEGTWAKAGTQVTITRDGQDFLVDYCVDGDTLVLDWPAEPDGTRVREVLFRYVN